MKFSFISRGKGIMILLVLHSTLLFSFFLCFFFFSHFLSSSTERYFLSMTPINLLPSLKNLSFFLFFFTCVIMFHKWEEKLFEIKFFCCFFSFSPKCQFSLWVEVEVERKKVKEKSCSWSIISDINNWLNTE